MESKPDLLPKMENQGAVRRHEHRVRLGVKDYLSRGPGRKAEDGPAVGTDVAEPENSEVILRAASSVGANIRLCTLRVLPFQV